MVKEEESMPREFYPGILSIREAAMECDIPETSIEEMLDKVEQEIMDCLSEQDEEEEETEEEH